MTVGENNEASNLRLGGVLAGNVFQEMFKQGLLAWVIVVHRGSGYLCTPVTIRDVFCLQDRQRIKFKRTPFH